MAGLVNDARLKPGRPVRAVLDPELVARVQEFATTRRVPLSVAVAGLLATALDRADDNPGDVDENVARARDARSASCAARGERGAASRWGASA